MESLPPNEGRDGKGGGCHFGARVIGKVGLDSDSP